MKYKTMTTLIACALGLSAAANAEMSKQDLKAESDRISVEYRSAAKSCDQNSGNAKDICKAEINGAEKVARADLEVRNKGTAKAAAAARIARADAAYGVDKQRCDDFAGNTKDICVKDARAAWTRATADAKVERKTTEANQAAHEIVVDAQRNADERKRKADYNAARERCDSLAGDSKDRCIVDARTRHGIN
jgi:hypothetical protein